jgi:hypothetical protein
MCRPRSRRRITSTTSSCSRTHGFLILYSFIKDALLQKNGFCKVYWEERDEEERETYYDLSDEQIRDDPAQDEDVEIMEHTVKIAGEEADEDPREDEAAEEQYAAT